MTDIYKAEAVKRADPAHNGAEITPSDSEDLSYTTRAIYVGTIGDLSVVMAGGQTVTLANVLGGTILPIAVTKVLNSGTDATDLVAFW